jgi:hypothetical protein
LAAVFFRLLPSLGKTCYENNLAYSTLLNSQREKKIQ